MIVRTAVAYCDHKGCSATHTLDPYITQHFRTLTELGWTLAYPEDETIRTYCPQHAGS